MHVQPWPIGRVKPYPGNPREITDRAVEKVAASIREFGFNQPIVVDRKGVIIVGHTRLRAAQKLGLKEVPVLEVDLPAGKARAYRLADNRTGEESQWVDELLRIEFDGLKALDLDLSMMTGFDAAEIRRVFHVSNAGLKDPDDIPGLPTNPVARLGDVWQLGPHRLACGDSTDPSTVVNALGDHKPNLMVTDPPYGVNYDPGWRHRLGVNVSGRTGKVKNDDRADWSAAWALFPGDIAYVWHGALHSSTVVESLVRHGFAMRAQIIWAKERLIIGRGDYHWQHEPCWYAVRRRGRWTGDRKQTTLWQISARHQDAATQHGTQKPVECMRRPMENNTKPGEAVYEPFMGSGTTLIAGQMADRVVLGVELDPAYVDVAITRWQNFTGKVATLDGRAFSEVEQERGKEGGKARRGGRKAKADHHPERQEVHARAPEEPAADQAEAARPRRRVGKAARAGA